MVRQPENLNESYLERDSILTQTFFDLRTWEYFGQSGFLSAFTPFTRYLTPLDYGLLELIEVTTGILGMVIGMGVSQAMSRFYYEFSEEEERNRVVSTVYLIIAAFSRTSLAVVGTQADLFTEWILNSESYVHYFVVAFMSLMLGIVIDTGQIYLRLLYKSTLYISISVAGLVVGVS